jgi:hypothetical protein
VFLAARHPRNQRIPASSACGANDGNIPGTRRRVNFLDGSSNGTTPQTTTQPSWLGLALETDRLPVLHGAGNEEANSLYDEQRERVRGRENRDVAEHALAKAKLTDGTRAAVPADEPWVVARVCSEYVQHCDRSLAAGSMSRSHRDSSVSYLNDLCGYCGDFLSPN